MPTLLNSNCGCVIVQPDGWQPETVALVNIVQKICGLLPPEFGSAVDAIVLKGSGLTLLIFKVGLPEAIEQEYYAEVSNDATLTLPTDRTIANIISVKVGSANYEPINAGGGYIMTDNILTFPGGVEDANVYITIT